MMKSSGFDSEVVFRQRLFRKLDTVSSCSKVAALIAPRGYGKSTLLATYTAHLLEEGRSALLVDCADEAPFARKSIDDLLDRTSEGDIGDQIPDQVIIDEIDALDAETLMLLESLIPCLLKSGKRLIFASNERSELFDSLLFKNRVALIDAHDLAFLPNEAREFFACRRTNPDEPKTHEALEAIMGFCDGWVMGMHLLTLESLLPPSICACSRSRNLDAFLDKAFVARLGDRDLLLAMRLSAVQVITREVTEIALGTATHEKFLNNLADKGLYLRCVDPYDCVYAFPLPVRLWLHAKYRSEHPEDARTTHFKLNALFLNRGDEVEAGRHLLLSANLQKLSDVAPQLEPYDDVADTEMLNILSEEDIVNSPFICLIVASLYLSGGNDKMTSIWLEKCKDGLTALGGSDGEKQVFNLCIRTFELKCLSLEERYEECVIQTGEFLQKWEAKLNSRLLSVCLHTLGEVCEHSGDIPQAVKYYRKASSLSLEAMEATIGCLSSYTLGVIALQSGNVAKAKLHGREMRERYGRNAAVPFEVLQCKIGLMEGDPEGALQHIELALEMIFEQKNPDIHLEALIAKALCLYALNKRTEAYSIVVTCTGIVSSYETMPRSADLFALLSRAWFEMRYGYHDGARLYLDLAHARIPSNDTRCLLMHELVLQVLEDAGGLSSASDLAFERMNESALEQGLLAFSVRIRARSALRMKNRGDETGAVLLFVQALDDAANHNLYGEFQYEPDTFGDLFDEVLAMRKLRRSTRRFVQTLCERVGKDGVSEAVSETDTPKKKRETLTKREREVLDLLNLGMSRKEIADELGISVNTAKAHLGNIYAKLGVTNKLDAFHAARENLI